MDLISSEEFSDFYRGYALLDSLSKLDYIPALYQMAFTHGWYSDAESMRRKELLGIDYDSKKDKGLPLEDSDNQKAITWLQTIIEKSDTTYPEINAQASYRLAGYYSNERVLIQDKARSLELLKTSRTWAKKVGDYELLQKIERGIRRLEK